MLIISFKNEEVDKLLSNIENITNELGAKLEYITSSSYSLLNRKNEKRGLDDKGIQFHRDNIDDLISSLDDNSIKRIKELWSKIKDLYLTGLDRKNVIEKIERRGGE